MWNSRRSDKSTYQEHFLLPKHTQSSQFNSQHGHILVPTTNVLESAMGLPEVREYEKDSFFSLNFEKACFIKNTKHLGRKKSNGGTFGQRHRSIGCRLEKERGRNRIY